MSQDRLVGLATLSIDYDIDQSIDINEIISSFFKLKAQKMGSVLWFDTF